ncbi:RelA/SpoT domain-containing protein [Roseovarius mucosus]|uniref:GTP pyrophosphokinase YjbM n=1 Tax=Roseovarius mucosus TaxID=215743 RepID=A0A1V0RT53_9RHOB|nr:RelA/SpoT domain-containing protein [Roseovarius mucosus]ARE84931.1 GTP pyrophosphokinase YjbM [Roseovarius mucosus]MBW4975355.1 RelA/SpoT domain-containing protein [Roseovarius mucosus]
MYTLSIERRYSKNQIKLAGRLLGGAVQRTPEVEEAFRIVHNWRLHHAYPMVRERAKLTRLVKPQGGLTAGRLKRLFSIRKKLFRRSAELDQMQDLVGCRAIVPSMDALQEVLSKYKTVDDGGRVRRKTDYIANPKTSGYRSIHLILKFGERGAGEKHVGCNVEIQLRTQLQHVWATTVEAVGSMRTEDLKAGEGNTEWLRFLTLMSGHIAELEGQPLGEHLSMSPKDLRREARELSKNLNVKHNLSTFSQFMHEADTNGGSYGSRYMLRMNRETGNIQVSPAWRELFAFDDLEDSLDETKQSIEVSVDNMASLRQAYPNYFADTRSFIEILDDLEGAKPPKRKSTLDMLDLSFLPKDPPTSNKGKVVYLDYTRKVYWGGDLVGRWEKGVYGTYLFSPGNEDYFAFESGNLRRFNEDLKLWLEGE